MAEKSGEPPARVGWAVAGVIPILVIVNVVDVRVAHASLVLGRPAPRGSWPSPVGLGSAGRNSAWAAERGGAG